MAKTVFDMHHITGDNPVRLKESTSKWLRTQSGKLSEFKVINTSVTVMRDPEDNDRYYFDSFITYSYKEEEEKQ